MNDNLLDGSNWKTYSIPGFSSENSIDKISSFKNKLFYLSQNKGIYYESNETTVPLVSNTQMNNMKIVGEKLACMATSQVYIFTDTKTFDQINNLSIKANQFEAINEAIILDGPYSNSSYDIVSKNDKIYIIPGGKSLTGDNSFNKAGSVMIYDYEKWSVLEPSVVQNKLNTWPKDYTSIVVTKNDTEKEIILPSVMAFFNS